MRHPLLLSTVLLTTLAVAPTATAASGAVVPAARPIAGSYLVLLNATTSVGGTAATLTRRYGGTVRSQYTATLRGFSVRGLSESQATRLAADPAVRTVFQDGTAAAAATPWGLDRLDQRQLPLDSAPFSANSGTGAGATVYLIDSGIVRDTAEFGDRIRVGADLLGGNGLDCAGHGTAVASVVGGKVHGVAKEAALVGLRVLDCTGTGPDSAVLDAVEWVAHNGTHPGAVAMSVTMDQTGVGDEAVRALIDAEFPTVVAAGNAGADACGTSPARVAEAITVAATDRTDTRPAYSNYGRCVDFFAPGSGVPALRLGGGEVSPSGTSMAAAHVAGIVAGWLGRNPYSLPAAVQSALYRAAVPGAVRDPGTGSPNQLANVAYPMSSELPVCGPTGNPTDVVIPDNGTTVTSTIGLSCPQTGAPGQVRVYLAHPRVGDLRIDLVSPTGVLYPLEQVGGDDGSGAVRRTYSVPNPSGWVNGTWTLRLSDGKRGAAGLLDKWVIGFGG
ncbi:S8 family serine peptidase [Actinokineospora sp. NBRC 105648]|uniref:S8 family serine peptidase n=1 Tax=Actinokineospora sp. NBRC 105648 TaxID=3032206 RepID=UPI0024A17585|nr:S8 family serine peptidase [Actinokineospora sp. NBRC 105648]GLZ41467.1 hypothetical protein Acsp05_50910 [Actinokineospora sp. NBRC 105648]